MLVSKRPVMMMVEARKIADVQLFTRAPLQDSYVTLWKDGKRKGPPTRLERLLKGAIVRLPGNLAARVQGSRALRRCSFSNRRFYKKLEW